MTINWSNIIFVLATLVIFGAGFITGKSQGYNYSAGTDVVDRFRTHNDNIDELLETEEGRFELARFVVGEAYLSGAIIDIENEIINSADNEDKENIILRIVKAPWKWAKKGKESLVKNREKLTEKLMNKANSMASSYLGPDKNNDPSD